MNSCVGCKYLYSVGVGYSNYTWEETEVNCLLDENIHLPKDEPYDWTKDVDNDNWPATMCGRCVHYKVGPYIELDIDGENGPADFTDDEEIIAMVCQETGRSAKGYLSDGN